MSCPADISVTLYEDLLAPLREHGATSPEQAAAIVTRYLQQQYGGDELYIPRMGRQLSPADVLADYAARMPMPDILRKYGISRSTYYRLLSREAAGGSS